MCFVSAKCEQAGRLPGSDSLSKLSEAQSLLAARDVLLACDRTTSGGDTYLVVSTARVHTIVHCAYSSIRAVFLPSPDDVISVYAIDTQRRQTFLSEFFVELFVVKGL